MRKLFLLGCVLLSVGLLGACEYAEQVSDFTDALGEGEDLGDDIQHVITIEEDEAAIATYTASLSMEDAEDEFIAYMEDQGFEPVDSEAELGYFVRFGEAGYGGTLLKDTTDYMYVYLSEGTSSVSIISVRAPQEAYESHYDDTDTTNGTDSTIAIPQDDVEGESLEALPRFEGAVRTQYAFIQEGDTTETYVEYLLEGDFDAVKTHYLDAVNTSSMSLEIEAKQGSEHYIAAKGEVEEANIIIRDIDDDVVEITIQFIEPS